MALYKKNEDGFEICLIKSDVKPKKSDWYILKEEDVTSLESSIQNKNYCTVIGPPRSQKSYILRAVKKRIENRDDKVCILLDLKSISSEVFDQFHSKFSDLFKSELIKQAKIATPITQENVIDTHSLKRFLYEHINLLNKDLVLLIDNLEKLYTKPRELFLETIREIHSEANRRLVFVIANSSSALEPQSSFPKFHYTFMEDLSAKASEKLIDSFFEQKGTMTTKDGRQLLIKNTTGDRHLIQVLCNYSFDLIDKNKSQGIIKQHEVKEAIFWFGDKEAAKYQPLQKCIQTIEADTISLLFILEILKKGKVKIEEMQKDWMTKTERLLIIGAIKEHKDGSAYTVRNKIYKEYLKNHFTPERVVNILTTAGKWREAVTYLENEIFDGSKDSSNYNWIYLGTVVHLIYAVSRKEEVYTSIARALKLIFDINKVSIYIENPERTKLVLVEYNGSNQDAPKDFFLDDEKYHTVTNAYK